MTALTRSGISASNPSEQDAALDLVSHDVIVPERQPAVVYLASLSAGSRRTMTAALNTIAGIASGTPDLFVLPWHRLEFGHTSAIRSKLAEGYAPATANRMLAAMRGTLKAAFNLGLMSADQMTRAISLGPVRGTRVQKGRAISQGELRALFDRCDPSTPIGARDAALLGLLYAGGLRRAEVVGLDVADFDKDTGALVIRGKGNKERRVFISNGANAALTAWLAFRGEAPGPLVLPVLKGGTIERRRMSDQAIADRLRHLGGLAKLQPFSPHDMRRTMISDLLDAGADIATVQQLAGHASPTTTSRYDRRGDRAKARAASLLHVPFGQ